MTWLKKYILVLKIIKINLYKEELKKNFKISYRIWLKLRKEMKYKIFFYAILALFSAFDQSNGLEIG